MCNKTYITLIIFPLILIGIIPIVGIVVQLGVLIWFGINGNKWAWQNKRWQSIEHFHRVQKNWAIAEIIMFCIGVVVYATMAALVLPVLMTDTTKVQQETMIKKEIATAAEAVIIQEAIGEKCYYTSDGIAAYFASKMNTDYSSGNTFKALDSSEWSLGWVLAR